VEGSQQAELRSHSHPRNHHETLLSAQRERSFGILISCRSRRPFGQDIGNLVRRAPIAANRLTDQEADAAAFDVVAFR
jgi:hypothetical protein